MKLISDIINELMDYEKPISGPLLKTKVLATRINNATLISWVNGELSGYSKNMILPEYRKTSGILMGNYMNGNMHYKNGAIPIAHLDKHKINTLTAVESRDSISSIENLIGQKGVRISVNTHAKTFLEMTIQDLGNHYFQLLSVYLDIPVSFLSDILSNVRSKLLDFMLELENEFGQETEIQELKTKESIINNIMNNTINNNGDGNILNTGGNSSITATINITKGDKKELSNILRENHIEDEDIDALLTVIDSEKPTKNSFGNKVNTWIQKMISKSLDGSWQVGIGAAGALLSEVVKKYYGL